MTTTVGCSLSIACARRKRLAIYRIAENHTRDGSTKPRPPRRSRRDFLRPSPNETNGAISELAFVALDRLNQSDEVERMRADIDDVNCQIRCDLARLKKITDFAQQGAGALALLALPAKIAEGLAGLVTKP